MEKKKLLASALVALTVVAAAPVSADLNELNYTGTLLAGGCGGGCGGKGRVAYNEQSCNNKQRAPSYTQSCQHNSYAPSYQQSCSNQARNLSYNSSQNAYQADNTPTQGRPSSYDATSGNAGFSADRPATQDWSSSRSGAPGSAEAYRSYSSEATEAAAGTSEADFQKQLSSQGRAIYQSLDAEGKALARQLGNQSNFAEKDLAVKEAQRRINERRGMSTAGSNNGWNR